jgi:hypothetical protein
MRFERDDIEGAGSRVVRHVGGSDATQTAQGRELREKRIERGGGRSGGAKEIELVAPRRLALRRECTAGDRSDGRLALERGAQSP